MSAPAIAMLIIAIVVVWGGLVAAIFALSRHPEEPDDAPLSNPPDDAPHTAPPDAQPGS